MNREKFPTFFTLSLWCRVRNSVENEHTRHANKKCSPHPRLSEPRRSRISGSPRRNRAVPRCVPLVAFRAESVDFFLFLFFVGKAKRSQIWWPNGVRGSLVVYASRAQRWTTVRFCPEIYSSRKCVRRKRYFRASLASRSGFPKRARENKSFGWKGKKRVKTSKRGCFLVFADPFLLSKKTNFSPNSLSLYFFKHRLQSPRCAWLKTKT